MWVSLNIVCACIYIYNFLACLCVSIRPFLSYFSYVWSTPFPASDHIHHTHTLPHSRHIHTFTHKFASSTHVCSHMCAAPGIPNYFIHLKGSCESPQKTKKIKKRKKTSFSKLWDSLWSGCWEGCIMNSFDFSLVEEQDPSVGLCPFFANHPFPQSHSKIVA